MSILRWWCSRCSEDVEPGPVYVCPKCGGRLR